MIYLTSDTHFGHDRQFIWGPRGFKSCKEADETIIKNWNSVVTNNDTVIHAGDFGLGKDIEYIKKVINRLNGKIILVIGNHDTPAKIKLYQELSKFVEVVWAKQIEYKGRRFYISHYPTMTADLNSNPEHCVFNLFGHTHSKEVFYEGRPYMYNVAVDAHDCKPVSIEQIYNNINNEIKDCLKFLV